MSTEAALGKRDLIAEMLEMPAPREGISLVDPGQAWIVTAGKLDLFLCSSSAGKPTGARHPLLRVETGGLVMGIEPLNEVMILAFGVPGTRVAPVPVDSLFARYCQLGFPQGSQADSVPTESTRLDDWVCSLAETLGGELSSPSLPSLSVAEGGSLNVEGAPRSISPSGRMVWIIHRRGSSRFLGRIALDVSTGLFPVARQSWLEAAAESEIYAALPNEHSFFDPSWTGLQLFNTAALEILSTQFHTAAEFENKRMRVKAEADRLLLDRSIHRLAGPIRRTVEADRVEDSCTHPVFVACQALASRMGFRVKPHPALMRGLPVADPVNAIARASNVRVRRVTLKGPWWSLESQGVLCFTEKGNLPLAILPGGKGLEVFDPADDSTTRLTAAKAETINPSAYVFYRPFPAIPLTARHLLHFAIDGTRREFVVIGLASIAAGLLALLTPYATGIVFDQLIPGAERTALAQMCLFLTIAALSSSLLGLARGYAVLRLQGRMDSRVQAAVWDRLLNLPVSFFRDYSSGDLAQRSLAIAKIREILTGVTINAILSGVFSFFSYALLFYYSWRLALIATALITVVSAISFYIGVLRLPKQRSLIRLEGKISSMLLQFMTGVSKFRVSGAEGRAFAYWGREFAQLKTMSASARRLSNSLSLVTAVYPLFSFALFFLCYYAFPSVSEGITTGDLVAFLAAFTQFLGSILTLSLSAVNALTVVPLFERATPILQAIPEVTKNKTNPGRLKGTLELNHITFRYRADGRPVLRDITLRIESGEFVAFVGASGSGKSTLFRLLLGFEKPESGAIYFDGQDLAGLDIQAVRSQIGVVLQTSKPISGSIYENIVGSAPFTIDDAWEAARSCGLDGDIRRMPMGMHTHIADGGGGISGGQRQRLLIARAIVAKPGLLFFDEATSALDNRTQEIVTRSLDTLQATRVVIAHRLSTILNADRIFVLDKGSVTQSGSYTSLMKEDGLFRKLAERQTI